MLENIINKKEIQIERIPTLDGFRGIFALMIIMFHAKNNTILTNNFLVRQSDLFVDYFFVLSGFVISYSYFDKIKSSKTFGDFLFKRVLRLYPLLLYTALLFGVTLFIGKYLNFLKSQDTVRDLIIKGLDTLTFMNSTPVFGSTLGINYPSWSISAEFISAIFFGVFLLKLRSRINYVFIISLLIFLFFFFIRHIYNFTGDYGFVRGLFCFLTGYFTFRFLKKKIKVKIGSILEISFLLVLIIIFKISTFSNNPLFNLIFPFIFSLGIYMFANSKGFITTILNSSSFQFIGRISYSIYLNHALVLIIYEKLLFSILNLSNKNFFVNLLYIFFAICSTIIYSYYTHEFIEVRFTNKLKKLICKFYP